MPKPTAEGSSSLLSFSRGEEILFRVRAEHVIKYKAARCIIRG